MKSILKNSIRSLFKSFGYSLSKIEQTMAVELDEFDVKLIKFVLEKKYSMASVPRLINTVKSCRYVVENEIAGDFVECGVWRGGNGILAKKLFEKMGSDKNVWMFDTFPGMTKPTSVDVRAGTKISAQNQFAESQKGDYTDWCYASLNEVKQNCSDSSLDVRAFRFVEGDICKTLLLPDNVPNKIIILRLDTDWYESTKIELEVLYPRLNNSGVLIIDDYGHWEGARKAVDEYFSSATYKPLFNVIDYTGRSAIKLG